MALTIQDRGAGINSEAFDGLSWRVMDILFDSAYPAGGYPIAPGDLGMTTILFVTATCSSGVVPEFDYTNSKLKCFQTITLNHVHTENTAGAYTQNATTSNPNVQTRQALVENTNGSAALAGITARILVLGVK